MRTHLSTGSRVRALVASVGVFMWGAGFGTAFAGTTPTTTVEVQVTAAATDTGTAQDSQNPTNVNGPSSASVSKSVTAGDGSNAGASASGFADFGTLEVGGSGSGLTPPAASRANASSTALASASWDDFLTAVPNPTSFLVPGASVAATLTLGLDFKNSALGLNNANAVFDYELSAGIVLTDPVTGVQSSITVVDDCFVFNDPDFNLCSSGSHRIDIPGNTGDRPLVVDIAPVTLPLAILQPFELGAGLSFFGECNAGPNDTAISSCTVDGDAMHTATATLQPLGDFTFVAASGHDYSLPITTPPGTAAEPGTLALIVAGLLPAALWRRRRRCNAP